MATRRKRSSSSQLNKLKEDTYNFDRLTYPSLNLGTDAIPNYIIFYINLPEPAGYQVDKSLIVPNVYSSSDRYTAQTRVSDEVFYGGTLGVGLGAATLQGLGSAVAKTAAGEAPINLEAGLQGAGADLTEKGTALGLQTAAGSAIAGLSQDIKKKPKFNRIKTAIALYMPDTVFQTYSHDYDALSVTDATGMLGLAQRAGTAISLPKELGFSEVSKTVESIKNVGGSAGGREVGGFLAEKTGLVNQGFTDLLLRDLGKAVNPQIEMVYKRTQNRSFVFDFRMQPRSSKESGNIKKIIKEFKRYAAPSLTDEGGAYFNIPGQFDIEFMFKNEENKFIGKISTCVLENIDVNYSVAGAFATFDDGAPVDINLQLRFKEVDTLTRELFDQFTDDEASF